MKPATVWERITFIPKSLPLPAILAYTALISPFVKAYKRKKLYRLINERKTRYLGDYFSVPQLQWFAGPTHKIYKSWAESYKIKPDMEITPEGVKLLWIGQRNAERVLFICHGGGFMLSVFPFMLTFWFYVQRELQSKGHNVSVVLFEYPLYPNAFPAQLTEFIHGLSHVLKRVKPANLHLAGDSAGGNLILQLFSHTLHPVPNANVPSSPLDPTSPIRGAALISPWTSMGDRTDSHMRNNDTDVLSSDTLIYWGKLYLENTSESHLQYFKFNQAPERWFEGIGRFVDRVWLFVGGAENLQDDGEGVYERLEKVVADGRPELTYELQEDGVHDDLMIEIDAGSKELNAVGKRLTDWLVNGF
ncbi:alpha beta hydrolase fold protein [Moniliophthora roreri MCA 2997]|uniref:Alpha beta hydrolase fold protein n=2 Tax=Moniliophthora roreri TaxID=221103 RepID=V2X192_MONRO|nr:alpha beta hydrolase fold protein [Moniliophthora roreri MCA 2997]KAI3597830.1 alpha beta hydrolase fold protein [Moniliophthora roreri]